MLYTADDLTFAFPPQYLARGRHYQRSGRVHDLTLTDNDSVIIARVTGTEPEPYEVFVEITRPSGGRVSIEGSCTCPMSYNCKHVAAALLQALEGKPPGGQRPPTLLDQWFRRLSATADPRSPAAYPPDVRERILYLLCPHPHQPTTVAVKVVVTRLLKAGGYGAERNYNPQNVFSGQPARFLSQADLSILQDLAVRTGLSSRLGGAEGATLLERMLTTGRCHWESKDKPPLSLGELRKAHPRWLTNAQGLTRLGFETDPPADWVLPVSPPWYVDVERGCCGPTKPPMPAALAAELATSPDLCPEDLPQVGDWLVQHLPSAQVPPPPTVEVKAVTLAPCPVLTLYSRPLIAPFYGYGKPDKLRYIDGARLTFDYQGEIVSPDDERQGFSRYQDGQVLRIGRDRKTEAACVRHLGKLGLRQLAKFHHSYALSLSSIPARDFGLPKEEHWLDFMLEAVPRLRAEGWRVEAEKDFRFHLATAGDWYVDMEEGSGIDWFGLTLGVEVDGEPVNLLPVLMDFLRTLPAGTSREWLEQLERNQPLMVPLPDGRLLPLPVERVRAILDILVELYDGGELGLRGNLNLPRIQAGRLGELETALQGVPLRWQGGAELRQLAERLRSATLPETVPLPAGLQAELRPYQQRGLAWLQFLREQTLGGILADDMGLGKTVQALAHILTEQAAGRLDRPCLIVAPTSLMVNWRNEATRFAPQLKVLTLRGPERQQRFAEIPAHDLVLTTYALLPRDQEALRDHHYHLLILDEAQAIKNPRSQAGQVVRRLKARHRLCLTGTPMENHLGELWSLYDFLMPGLLGDEQQFRRLFRRPIEQAADETRRQALARRIAPFLLRRTKEQVATELPAKTEIIRTVELSGPQRDLYESIRLAMQEKVRQEISKKGLARSHIVILEALLKLRQVCCDPRLLKLTAARRVKQSAKLQLLLEILPELVEDGRHILLFSQFTSMLSLIEADLARLKIDYVKLTGQTQDRATPIERFQAGAVPLFLISLKAGGVGLNLTAADTVIHYDPWWNPAVEDQATDRAHRIGQDKPVFVYKLFTEGTVEEKIRTLQARKRVLTEGLLSTEDTNASPWTDQDLELLFAPLS